MQEIIAWKFELARSVIHGQNGHKEWTNWGPPQLSFDKPNVPKGSIRNLIALVEREEFDPETARRQAEYDSRHDEDDTGPRGGW